MKSLIMKVGCVLCAMHAATFALDRTLGTLPGPGEPNCTEGTGWYTLFDGTQALLDKYFWLPTGQAHGDGGRWWIENGTLFSDQNSGGQGGVLFTKNKYKNVEVKVSVKLTWGNDGGIFFRSNAYGRSYQVVLDYKDEKNLGGVWGESGLHSINHKAFAFAGSEDRINPTNNWVDPINASEWSTKIWKKGDFNLIHAKFFKNDPPWIESWINGYKMIHYEDTRVETQNLTGHVGLQIHQGTTNWRAGFPNAYKSFYIRSLDPEGQPLPLDDYPEWKAGCATSGITASKPGSELGWRQHGDRLVVAGTAKQDFTLTVMDISGKVIAGTQGKAGNYSWEAKGLRSGIYFLSIRSGHSARTVKIARANG